MLNNYFVFVSRATHCRRVDETHPARGRPYQRLHPPACQVRTAKQSQNIKRLLAVYFDCSLVVLTGACLRLLDFDKFGDIMDVQHRDLALLISLSS